MATSAATTGAERLWSATPASPGIAIGRTWRPAVRTAAAQLVPPARRTEERARARSALEAASDELSRLAAGLSGEEAEIVEAGALMAQDPALGHTIENAVAGGVPATDAIIRATAEYADLIASIGDEHLAARADDVRSLGRRAARLAAGEGPGGPPGTDLILIADDLGPADVAEHASILAGCALAAGGATAHAAIVARSLGIPMVTGAGPELLAIADGDPLVVDGSSGTVALAPSEQRAAAARADMQARRNAAARERELAGQPAVTVDGVLVTVLANVASPDELRVGLRAGAEGIGLLRTELAFLDAEHWPSPAEHQRSVEPILAGLGPRRAVVRVLDFGADKAPPFLRGVSQRGIELLLAHPEGLAAQLRGLLAAGHGHDLRILVPMVETVAQMQDVRRQVARAAAAVGLDTPPPLGAMIETPAAADAAGAIAAHSDFLSIGTNDLTAATLGEDRFAATAARAHHPSVLRCIARSAAAAHDAGIRIEVCGEAASDALMVPLLIGLGVDELSVGAARVGQVRQWIRTLDARAAAGLAHSALTMDDDREVEWAVRRSAGMAESAR